MINSTEKILADKKGVTIVEMLLGIVIMLLILAAVYVIYNNLISNSGILSSNLQVQYDVRQVFNGLSDELRSASLSSTGAYTFATATTNTVIFFSDIDGDGLKEQVHYFLNGRTLSKGVIKPSGNPLVYVASNEKFTDIVHDIINASTPVFSYYDSSYDGTNASLTLPINLTAIRLVKIYLVVDSNSKRAPLPIEFTTQVSIRNLKDNL